MLTCRNERSDVKSLCLQLVLYLNFLLQMSVVCLLDVLKIRQSLCCLIFLVNQGSNQLFLMNVKNVEEKKKPSQML